MHDLPSSLQPHTLMSGAIPSPAPMTCSRLREWVRAAQPNARVTYARGLAVSQVCTKELREYVMALYELGYITPHMVRDNDRVPTYFVQRTARPVPKGAVL